MTHEATRMRIAPLLACLAVLALIGSVRAASVETLLMPGKLTTAHAKLEADCTNCHDRSKRAKQDALCLSCHKDVAADVAAHTGFHGRMPNAGVGECQACHSEHLGRDADIVRLDRPGFDHAATDFPLTGAHQTLSCGSCHRSGEAFRKASGTCIACHRQSDIHAGRMGTSCEDCHSSASWSGARFDHSRTKFALSGAHQTTSCNACHLGGRYKGVPMSCNGCHATDDVHRGERGTDCAKCHTTREWRTATFDHARETQFALLGKHAAVTCAGCHRSGRYEDKLPRDCVGCHRSDDAHAGRFGEKCADCHDNDAWKNVDFDHGKRGGFELEGAHAKVACNVCHVANLDGPKLGKDCVSCHRAIDPHGGKLLAGCETCHGQTGWRQDVSFDHDLTDYPLLGLHAAVTCAQCHRSLDFKAAPRECVGCHLADDVHKTTLGAKCESCHSSNGWKLWQFDHSAQTKFPLTGAHQKLGCAACHRQGAPTMKIASDCASCHRQDDRHQGQFGLQCERCHSTWTFKGARIQ